MYGPRVREKDAIKEPMISHRKNVARGRAARRPPAACASDAPVSLRRKGSSVH